MSSSKTLNNLNIRKFPSKASFKNATNIGEDDLCVVAGSGEPLMQLETMPTAAAEWEGQVVMFVGTSTSEFTQGYLYRCMGNGDDTYFWTLNETQPAPATYATATQTTIKMTERTLKIRVGPNFRADDFSYQPYPYRSFVHIYDSNGNEFVGSVTYVNNDACEQHIYKATGIFEGKRFFVVGNTATSQNFYIAISDGTNNPISSSSLTLQVEYQYYGNLGGGVFDVFANSTQSEIFVSIPENNSVAQFDTLPTASADNLGDIVQFTGTTDANYTNGYFYKCVSDGQDPATYSWEAVEVQAGGGATYTAGAGISIDANNEISVVAPTLQNNTTIARSIAIGESSTGYYGNTVSIGYSAKVESSNSLAIGGNTRAYGADGSIAIGNGTAAQSGIAIGQYAKTSAVGTITIAHCGNVYSPTSATAAGAIQLGSRRTNGQSATNSDADTLKVANINGNFEIMSADGTVPTARLTKVNTTATLAAGSANWTNNEQTVTVSGVKADSVVFVSPDPTSASDYASAGILCTAQVADRLTFTCTTTPSNAITVNVVCM